VAGFPLGNIFQVRVESLASPVCILSIIHLKLGTHFLLTCSLPRLTVSWVITSRFLFITALEDIARRNPTKLEECEEVALLLCHACLLTQLHCGSTGLPKMVSSCGVTEIVSQGAGQWRRLLFWTFIFTVVIVITTLILIVVIAVWVVCRVVGGVTVWVVVWVVVVVGVHVVGVITGVIAWVEGIVAWVVAGDVAGVVAGVVAGAVVGAIAWVVTGIVVGVVAGVVVGAVVRDVAWVVTGVVVGVDVDWVVVVD